MAGGERVRRSRRLREAPVRRVAAAAGVAPEDWRDWAGGLPDEVLATVAGKVVAQTEAGWAARLKEVNPSMTEERIQWYMEKRKREGNCLFVFARVCKGWRKAQLKVGGPLRTRVGSDVILPGSVALVKWVLAEGCPREGNGVTMAQCAAAQYGHTELVKWLCGEGGFAMDEKVMRCAAGNGNLELVRWLKRAGCGWDKSLSTVAGLFGRPEVLQWLCANGCPWEPEMVCRLAARLGHLEVLRWARDNGGKLTEDLCMEVAFEGHLVALQNLRAVGCPWGAKVCHTAANRGQLEILKWLRGNGCPWDVMTCFGAVTKGHVEVLRWARENGAPWNTWTRVWAAEKLGYTDDFGNLDLHPEDG